VSIASRDNLRNLEFYFRPGTMDNLMKRIIPYVVNHRQSYTERHYKINL